MRTHALFLLLSWCALGAAARAGEATAPDRLVEVAVDLLEASEAFGAGDDVDVEGVIGFLGGAGDRRAVPALVAWLEAEDENIRESAAVALGSLGDPRAVTALAARLADDGEEDDVREAAAVALGRIGGPAPGAALATVLETQLLRWQTLEALNAGDREDSPGVYAPLVARLAVEDGGRKIRAAARRVARKPGDEEAVDDLWELLDEGEDLLKSVIAAAGRSGDPRPVPVLDRALDSSEEWVRRSSAAALGRIGGDGATAILARRLQDEALRIQTLEALEADTPDTGVYRPLIRRLAAEDSSAALRASAARAAAEVDIDSEAVEVLWDLLDESGDLRLPLALALARVGDARAVPALLDAVEPDEPGAEGWRLRRRRTENILAAWALRDLGGPADLESLRRRLGMPLRVVVPPFQGSGVPPEAGWLGYGLAGDVIEQLVRMPAFDPWIYLLPELGAAGAPAAGRPTEELFSDLIRGYAAEQVWLGGYSLAGDRVEARLAAYDAATGRRLAEIEVAADLPQIRQRLAQAVVELVARLGAPAVELRPLPATGSFEAWSHYSRTRLLGSRLDDPEPDLDAAAFRRLLVERRDQARAALALDPGFARARGVLGSTLLELGDAAALGELEQAAAAAPDSALIQSTLAAGYERADDLDGAMRLTRRVAELAPSVTLLAADHLRVLQAWMFARFSPDLKARRNLSPAEIFHRGLKADPELAEIAEQAARTAWRLAAGPDLALRTDSLSALARFDPRGAREVLEQALEDPRSRAIAVWVSDWGFDPLANGLASYVRDPDPRVRLAALETVAPRSWGGATLALALAALDDPVPEVRAAALAALPDSPPWAVDSWDPLAARIGAAGDPSPAVRRAACLSIARFFSENFLTTDPRLTPALSRCLQDRDPGFRHALVETVAGLDGSRLRPSLDAALPILVLALADDDPGVRAAAMAAAAESEDAFLNPERVWLGPQGSPRLRREYLEQLRAALREDPDPRLRAYAGMALAALGDRDAIEPLKAIGAAGGELAGLAFDALSRFHDPSLAPVFLGALEDGDPERRTSACAGLGRLRHAPAVPALAAQLRTAPLASWRPGALRNLRLAAVWALGRIRDSAAVGPLLESLADDDPAIRAYSAWALGEAGSARVAEVAPALAAALEDTEEVVSTQAVHGLAALSGRRARPELVAALDSEHPEVREHALFFLARIMDPATEAAVVDLLDDPDRDVRAAAVEALEAFGGAGAAGPLLEMLGSDRETAGVLPALRRLAGAEVLPALMRYLEAQPPRDRGWVAEEVIETVAAVGGQDAVPYLVRLLESGEPRRTAELAAAALGALGSAAAAAVAALAGCLESAASASLRIVCAASLAELGAGAGERALIDYLEQPSAALRSRVMETIDDRWPFGETPGSLERAIGRLLDEPSPPPAAVDWLLWRGGAQSHEAVRRLLRGEAQLGRGLSQSFVAGALMWETAELPADLLAEMAAADGPLRLVPLLAGVVAGDLSRLDELMAGLGRLPGDPLLAHSVLDQLETAGIRPSAAALEPLRDVLPEVWFYSQLGRVAGARAVPELAAVLARGDQGSEIAFRGLADAGGPEAVRALIDHLEERYRPWGAHLGPGLQLWQTRPPYLSDRGMSGPGIWARDTGRRDEVEAVAALAEREPAARRGLLDLFLRHQEPVVLAALARHQLFADDWQTLATPATDLGRAGLLYLQAVQLGEAERWGDQARLAREALALLDTAVEAGLAIHCLWLRVHAEIHLGDAAAALAAAKEAQDLLPLLCRRDRRDFGVDFEATGLYWLGRVLAEAGDAASLRRAEEAYRAALDQVQSRELRWRYLLGRPGVLDSTLEERLHTRLSLLHDRLRAEHLKAAVRLGEGKSPGDVAALEDREERLLAQVRQLLLDDGSESTDRALEHLDQLQLTRQQYFRRHRPLRLADGEEQEILDQYQARRLVIERLKERLRRQPAAQPSAPEASGADDLQAAGAGGGEIELLDQQIFDKERELRRYFVELKRRHPQLASLLRAEPVELKRVRELLPDDVVVLQYLLLPEELVIFVVRGDGVDQIPVAVGRGKIEALVRDYLLGHIAMARRVGAETGGQKDLLALRGVLKLGGGAPEAAEAGMAARARELHRLLVEPVTRWQLLRDGDRLGVAPNGILHYLPFAALRTDADGEEPGYLVDRHAIFYVHGASLLWTALQRSGRTDLAGAELWALSDPDGSLRAARREVDAIAGLFARSRVFPGAQATRAVLTARGQGPRVVHLAAHGVLDAGDGTASYLKLADGRLTVDEVWGLPFGDVSLTTLSACQTGIGEVLSGDDLISLENAFVYAGSATVLATLWPVESESTADLMTGFYRHLHAGLAKAEALAAAQRELKRDGRFEHPFYWAGFTLRGTWN